MMKGKIEKWFIVPYILIGLMPLCLFILDGLLTFVGEGGSIRDLLLMERERVLLLKSLLYTVAVTLMATGLGFFCALGLLNMKKIIKDKIVLFLIILLPLPVCIHGLVWMEVLALNTTLMPQSGMGLSIVVQSLALLPLAILSQHWGMSCISRDAVEAGMIFQSKWTVFFKIWTHEYKSTLYTTATLIFLLTFNDYQIPATFSTVTYAMEIFSQYSISLSSKDALVSALPMILIGLILSSHLVTCMKGYFLNHNEPREDLLIKEIKPLNRYLGKLVLLVALIGLSAPIVLLFFRNGLYNSSVGVVNDALKDSLSSLIIVLLAGSIATPIMFLAAYSLKEAYKKQDRILLILIILPAVISPSLIGAALIHTFKTGPLQLLYPSIFIPSLAIAIRFMPIGTLIIYSRLYKLDSNLRAIGLMVSGSQLKTIYKISVPLSKGAIGLSFMVVFLLGIGEVGATVMVLPPGVSTIAVRIYGYLHYGASEIIGHMSQLVMLFIGLSVWGLHKMGRASL